MRTVRIAKLSDIPKLAKQVAKELKGGEILALVGPLGAGKTTFVKTLALELKIKKKVTSPTFTLMHHFPFKLKGQQISHFYHLDLYRTKNFREVKTLGIEEFWGQKNTITAIEWADKIKKHLPAKAKFFIFEGQYE